MFSRNEFRISDHVLVEMERRGLEVAAVEQVVIDPEQVVAVRSGRIVCQSRVESGSRLLRAIVDIDRHPAVVVTAYKTSNLRKYWQQS